MPVQLGPALVDTLMQRAQRATVGGARRYEVVVDLAEQSVSDESGFVAPFAFDPYRRELLLRGLDEIDRTLLEEPRIAEYERLHQ